MQHSEIVMAAFNLNRAMQEMELACQKIDEAIEELQGLKKNLNYNISVAKCNVELLYNAQRDTSKFLKESV